MSRPEMGAQHHAQKIRLPWQGDLYITAIVLAAVAMTVLTFNLWSRPLDVNPLLWLEFLVINVLAIHFPLEVGEKVKLNLGAAVDFAALLVFPAPAVLLMLALAMALGGAALRVRLRIQGRPGWGWRPILFNGAQWIVAYGLGSLVYHLFVPQVAPATLERTENLWAIPITAAVIFLSNSLAVAVMVAIQFRRDLWSVWVGFRSDLNQYAALYLVGLVGALCSTVHLLAPLVMVLPAILIYVSLRRTRDLVRQTLSAVEAMADVVDTRDPYTFQHSQRVAETSAEIARVMGLSGEDIETIRLAARVHDLGKIGVPDSVLRKAGRLDDEERRLMERHPDLGYQILARFPEYRRGRELVRAHHERFDGKGYPRGLCGGEFPLGAQILAVADAFDAMTSERPYRREMSVDEAVEELRRGSGSQWHPRVVEAMMVVAGEDAAAVAPGLRLVVTA